MTPPRYMLDTNFVSNLIRNPAGKAAQRLRAVGDRGLAISIITAAELRFGAAKSGSPRLLSRVEAILDALVLAFDVPADAEYANIRIELEASGKPIGPQRSFDRSARA